MLYTPCFEMETGSWGDAATIYANLGKRASEDWDFDAINKCLYLSFTCKHRKIIKTDPLSKKHTLLNLVIDSFLAGPVGWFWLICNVYCNCFFFINLFLYHWSRTKQFFFRGHVNSQPYDLCNIRKL